MTTKNTPKKDTPLHELKGFDAIIAKRAEALNNDGKTFTFPGFGRDWHLTAPELAGADWNDRFADLLDDVRSNSISNQDYREELLDLILSEEADEFAVKCDEVGVDPATLINAALQQYAEERQENPTPRGSRTTPRRVKRR